MKTITSWSIAFMMLAASVEEAWTQTEVSPPLASPLTFDQAIAIALEKQLGEIAEVALERAHGKVVIEIEVVNDAGDEIEFQLDAQTGEILSTWTDDDPSDDPGEALVEGTD